MENEVTDPGMDTFTVPFAAGVLALLATVAVAFASTLAFSVLLLDIVRILPANVDNVTLLVEVIIIR